MKRLRVTKCLWLPCGLAAALLAALWALPPESLVCRAWSDCQPMSLLGLHQPSVGMSLQGLTHMLGNFIYKSFTNSGHVLVHVGPSITDEGDIFLARNSPGLFPAGSFRAIYVEPNARLLGLWRLYLGGLGLQEPQMCFIRAAVCAHNAESATLFQATQQLRLDFLPQLGPDVLVEHASMNKTRLMDWLRALGSETKDMSSDNLSSYIESTAIRCITPSSLLQEARVKPSSVDQLGVDMFGQDALEIVELFLALDDFRPHCLTFEYRGHHGYEADVVATLQRIVRSLAARGYDIHRVKDDIFAVARLWQTT